jgi:hypothetical protein
MPGGWRSTEISWQFNGSSTGAAEILPPYYIRGELTMTKMQASMKESSMKRQSYALSRIAYKVGSFFKGCHQCGDFEWVSLGSREVKRYSSGYNVHRAYAPSTVHWTYWCSECGARDLKAWENASDIGEFAIRGTRDAVARSKGKEIRRKERLKFDAKAEVKDPVKDSEIEALEKEVERLEELLKGVK